MVAGGGPSWFWQPNKYGSPCAKRLSWDHVPKAGGLGFLSSFLFYFFGWGLGFNWTVYQFKPNGLFLVVILGITVISPYVYCLKRLKLDSDWKAVRTHCLFFNSPPMENGVFPFFYFLKKLWTFSYKLFCDFGLWLVLLWKFCLGKVGHLHCCSKNKWKVYIVFLF